MGHPAAQEWTNDESFLMAGAGFVDSKTSTQLTQNGINLGLAAMALGSESGCN
jgi:hypothetical protein